MSDELIVRHGSPTLAGLKTGNLFSCPCTDKKDLIQALCSFNQRLVPKGIRLIPLRFSVDRALLYIYRPQKLEQDFMDRRTVRLLETYGYCVDTPGSCLRQLSRRLYESEEFPHEIGLFLGYPPEDVQGFIEHHAEGCKCVGCWKVYGDEESAKRKFEQYRRCTDCYCAQWEKGMSIERLVEGT